LRPLKWVGGSKKSLDGLPEDVKDVFGSALLDVQYGGTPDGAKPFGEGLPHEIWKIVEDHDSDTYRAVYTATFPEVVYVLDAFVKNRNREAKRRRPTRIACAIGSRRRSETTTSIIGSEKSDG
jgi:phage-related protein